MYTTTNYRSKKQLKEAIEAGTKVSVFQPNNFMNTPTPKDGKVYLEGPHYPEPHKWYVEAWLKDGYIYKVK